MARSQKSTVSLRRSAAGLEKAVNQLEVERSLKRVEGLIGHLETTASTLDRSLQSTENILGRIDRGEGTLGKLTTDEELYDNVVKAAASFDETATELQALLEDIRLKPKKYVKLSLF